MMSASAGPASAAVGAGVQPGLERPGILVLAALAPDRQEHFLEQLLAQVAVAGHAVQEGQQRAGVATQQPLQQFRLAVLHPRHQVLVAVVVVHTGPPASTPPICAPHRRR
jgi:hypothetical protein